MASWREGLSGCSLTMVHADKVPPSKVCPMEKVPVKCVHGDTKAQLGRDLYDVR